VDETLPADRRLKRPVKAHFTIRQVPGSDIEPHHVGRLVLPSHKEVEVEVGIHALTNFRASEVIFGCKGNEEIKPAVTGRARQFVKTGNLPEPVYYIDHADWCHAIVNRDYNKGTHHVMGFQVRTRDEGLFKALLSFVTDEIEGNYDGLEILVEDRPHTVMYCRAKEHVVIAGSIRYSHASKTCATTPTTQECSRKKRASLGNYLTRLIVLGDTP